MTSTVATKFASANSPFTGAVPLKHVPIPQVVRTAKGTTKYDAEFERLLEMRSAIETTEAGFTAINRALARFMENKKLRGKLTVRRTTNTHTHTVTVWLEKKDAVPNLRSVDGSKSVEAAK